MSQVKQLRPVDTKSNVHPNQIDDGKRQGKGDKPWLDGCWVWEKGDFVQ